MGFSNTLGKVAQSGLLGQLGDTQAGNLGAGIVGLIGLLHHHAQQDDPSAAPDATDYFKTFNDPTKGMNTWGF